MGPVGGEWGAAVGFRVPGVRTLAMTRPRILLATSSAVVIMFYHNGFLLRLSRIKDNKKHVKIKSHRLE